MQAFAFLMKLQSEVLHDAIIKSKAQIFFKQVLGKLYTCTKMLRQVVFFF